jgi:hypothetical protein
VKPTVAATKGQGKGNVLEPYRQEPDTREESVAAHTSVHLEVRVDLVEGWLKPSPLCRGAPLCRRPKDTSGGTFTLRMLMLDPCGILRPQLDESRTGVASQVQPKGEKQLLPHGLHRVPQLEPEGIPRYASLGADGRGGPNFLNAGREPNARGLHVLPLPVVNLRRNS